MPISEIKNALDGLSKGQRYAVDWQDGALLVLARPGSEKTRALATRIARLLIESPERRFRIAGLTFTNRAAEKMKRQLSVLAPEVNDRMSIGTFQSFFSRILWSNGSHIGVKGNFSIYPLERDREYLLERCLRSDLSNNEMRLLRRYQVLRLIDHLHENLVSPRNISEYFSLKQMDEEIGEAIAHAYKSYHRAMKRENAVDPLSLVFFIHKLFRTYPQIARLYQKTHPYWCLDEFQNINEAQYRLIVQMATGGFQNILAVADDDRIAYRWNGADYRRLGQFQRDFSAERIQLPANYRCPGPVVRLADNLIVNNSHRSSDKKSPIAMRCGGNDRSCDSYELLRFDSDDDEFRGVASRVAEIRRSSTGAIAVLGRSRVLLERIKEELDRRNIPSFIAQRRNEFKSIAFRFIDAALHQSLSRGDERFVADLVGAFSAAADPDMALELGDVLLAAQAKHGDYLRGWFEEMMRRPLSQEAKDLAQCVKSTLIDGIDYRSFVKKAMEFFESAGIDSPDDPFSEYEEDKKAWDAIERDIHRSLGEKPSLEVFLQELELRSKESPPTEGAVALMTIHSTRGSGFHTVFLIGLAEEVLPSWQSIDKGDESPELEEERRNCFVAITRTENRLVLSYARRYRGREKKPSRFLEEMGVIL